MRTRAVAPRLRGPPEGEGHRAARPEEHAMFGSIGMPELIVIFFIALIIFGPRKLPELGKSLGKSLNEFRRASNELRNSLEDEIRIEEQRDAQAKTRPAEPAEAAPRPRAVDDAQPRGTSTGA
jgi:sec-independent protein translocase protein TatA